MNIPQIHLNSNDFNNTDDSYGPKRKQRKLSIYTNQTTTTTTTMPIVAERQQRQQRTVENERPPLNQLQKQQYPSPPPSLKQQPSITTSIASTESIDTDSTTRSSNQSAIDRMSMFFFRLHNLQREQENKRKKLVQQQRQRQRRGAKVFRSDSDTTGHLTLAPSRLFEKTPIKPSDSLDEIALQIPRYLWTQTNYLIHIYPSYHNHHQALSIIRLEFSEQWFFICSQFQVLIKPSNIIHFNTHFHLICIFICNKCTIR